MTDPIVNGSKVSLLGAFAARRPVSLPGPGAPKIGQDVMSFSATATNPIETAARKVRALLPPGIEVSTRENGLTFSRNGEAFYSATLEDGGWRAGGFRQHGLRGHADSPAAVAALQGAGLLPAPVNGAAPPPPAGPPALPGASQPATQDSPIAAAAQTLRELLPPNIDIKVRENGLTFSRNGEAFYSATLEGADWSAGGFRQHGFRGHADSPMVQRALEDAGLVAPPAVVAPPAPLPAPVVSPGAAGYAALARKLESQLPGIDIKVGERGLTFSRNGEAFYSAGVQEGEWRTGGFRQHGFRGHPDSPTVQAVLKANGIN